VENAQKEGMPCDLVVGRSTEIRRAALASLITESTKGLQGGAGSTVQSNPTANISAIRLLCPSKELFTLINQVDKHVITPIITNPRYFCVLKEGFIGYIALKVKEHEAYSLTADLFAKYLGKSFIDDKLVNTLSKNLCAKMYDVILRSAANDFVTNTLGTMKALQNSTAPQILWERLTFRLQVTRRRLCNSSSFISP
jgi:hypothetical protein